MDRFDLFAIFSRASPLLPRRFSFSTVIPVFTFASIFHRLRIACRQDFLPTTTSIDSFSSFYWALRAERWNNELLFTPVFAYLSDKRIIAIALQPPVFPLSLFSFFFFSFFLSSFFFRICRATGQTILRLYRVSFVKRQKIYFLRNVSSYFRSRPSRDIRSIRVRNTLMYRLVPSRKWNIVYDNI